MRRTGKQEEVYIAFLLPSCLPHLFLGDVVLRYEVAHSHAHGVVLPVQLFHQGMELLPDFGRMGVDVGACMLKVPFGMGFRIIMVP